MYIMNYPYDNIHIKRCVVFDEIRWRTVFLKFFFRIHGRKTLKLNISGTRPRRTIPAEFQTPRKVCRLLIDALMASKSLADADQVRSSGNPLKGGGPV